MLVLTVVEVIEHYRDIIVNIVYRHYLVELYQDSFFHTYNRINIDVILV